TPEYFDKRAQRQVRVEHGQDRHAISDRRGGWSVGRSAAHRLASPVFPAAVALAFLTAAPMAPGAGRCRCFGDLRAASRWATAWAGWGRRNARPPPSVTTLLPCIDVAPLRGVIAPPRRVSG